MRDPGLMQDRILIERPVTTRDAAGGESIAWETVRTVWARRLSEKGVETVRTVWARRLSEKGVETFAGAALLGKVEIGFSIRFWKDHSIDQMHRFTHQGRVYNIASAVEAERHTELVLLGNSGANRG